MNGYIGNKAKRRKRKYYLLSVTLIIILIFYLLLDSEYFTELSKENIDETNLEISKLEANNQQINLLNNKINKLNNDLAKEKLVNDQLNNFIKNLNSDYEKKIKEIDKNENLVLKNITKEFEDIIKQLKEEKSNIINSITLIEKEYEFLENQVKVISNAKINLEMKNDLLSEKINELNSLNKELKILTNNQENYIEQLKDLLHH